MCVVICIINEVPLKFDQPVLPCFTRLVLFKSASLSFLVRFGIREIREGGRGSALTFMCDHVAKSIKSYFRVGTLGRNAEHEQLSSHVQLGAFSFYLKGVYLLAPVSFRSNRRILSGELSYNYKGILRIKT